MTFAAEPFRVLSPSIGAPNPAVLLVPGVFRLRHPQRYQPLRWARQRIAGRWVLRRIRGLSGPPTIDGLRWWPQHFPRRSRRRHSPSRCVDQGPDARRPWQDIRHRLVLRGRRCPRRIKCHAFGITPAGKGSNVLSWLSTSDAMVVDKCLYPDAHGRNGWGRRSCCMRSGD
jgi:hypothetical protein